ncbi:DUF885 domain-containing protein [Granulicella mallensis]|uniref:DUF885 domain-containing protein n=1 Tax=Granulicella mallensis (strain ATCC BAA-1857 / DSM 23137 / MP5ACTX8) TaxID=682795 RepID=G8NNK6_GRAMM|nr:DUF885 domain-containing protein [Granulicella mallensis]AEU34791.1 protein of unknown function DUF885 [Granulicella mallensis MP5ACTX8]
MRTLLSASLAGALMLTALPASAQHLSADGASQTFNYLTEQYFDQVYFKFSPTAGTGAGLHQYDTQLEDYSAANVQKETAALHDFEKKLAEIDPTALDAEPAADYQILMNNVHATLLQLEVIRGWEKNPDSYSSGVTSSIFSIMERPYAPVNTRLRAAVERERQIPQALLEARKNLKNPPHIYTEIALEQIDGLVSFFQSDVPEAFKDADDAKAKADFAKTNAAAIDALKSYGAWMKSDLLPRSNGDFRYGADTFQKALAYNEMVDIPLDRLLQIAMDDLHKNQAEFARVAKEIDPAKTPQEELAELATIHPAPDQLLGAFHSEFDSLITYIRSHHIITIPSDVQPTLEETPPFMRATTQASMDPPGAFETHSTKAYFNVTLPEKGWTPERVAEHMAAFNIGTIVSTGVHEAYPGHYVQFLWQPQFPSKIRKLLGANTNIEGWAHYCEQMMLDEGYGQPGFGAKTEREAKLIRLGQLQDALLRDARFVVSIRMHTGTGGAMSFDDAVNFFVKEGYQSRAIGTMETKRGTSDALYLYYTLGKLEIMKLREDVKKKQGPAFDLQHFHDDFMRQGFAPVKVIRKTMLHDDSPVL